MLRCLYAINAKTAEPLGPTFFVAIHMKNVVWKKFYFYDFEQKNPRNFEFYDIFKEILRLENQLKKLKLSLEKGALKFIFFLLFLLLGYF